jgi:pheromone shutdown-related protein TraB
LIKECKENNYKHTLAIVGAGHLKGIKEILINRSINDTDRKLEELDAIPNTASWFKYLPWMIVALILIGFAFGFDRSSDMGIAMIIDWVFINGGLAALGALIALAHPLTILAAFLAAPITSLNPMIGAGMVAATAEIFIRKPQVEDFSRLRSDAATLKGWWHNQVTRILLIFLLSSFGSAMGTYIAGFRIFERLSSG